MPPRFGPAGDPSSPSGVQKSPQRFVLSPAPSFGALSPASSKWSPEDRDPEGGHARDVRDLGGSSFPPGTWYPPGRPPGMHGPPGVWHAKVGCRLPPCTVDKKDTGGTQSPPALAGVAQSSLSQLVPTLRTPFDISLFPLNVRRAAPHVCKALGQLGGAKRWVLAFKRSRRRIGRWAM